MSNFAKNFHIYASTSTKSTFSSETKKSESARSGEYIGLIGTCSAVKNVSQTIFHNLTNYIVVTPL